LELPQPAAWHLHAEIRELSAKGPAIVREMAGEDRPMPPADSLRLDMQWSAPERPLRIVQHAAELITENLPGLLRAPSLVEPRLLAITEAVSSMHSPMMPTTSDRRQLSWAILGSKRQQG